MARKPKNKLLSNYNPDVITVIDILLRKRELDKQSAELDRQYKVIRQRLDVTAVHYTETHRLAFESVSRASYTVAASSYYKANLTEIVGDTAPSI